MANSAFTSALRSFWHTMTSYDRHSSFDSPHRTGRHVPLSDARRSILTGVATASDSRPDITAYSDEAGRNSPRPTAGHYSPGMRSSAAQQTEAFETQSSTDVPMQSFQDGLPPPPPVRHSWKRIDSWAEDNYPELHDQLGEGATNNDLNDLEHQLDCSLPQDVRESLMIHDGQERGGNPTGIIFGSMLLDCEEIVQEWETWRRVYHQFLLDTSSSKPPTAYKAPAGGSSEASSSKHPPSSSSATANSDEWRHSLLSRQESVPPGAVQKAYAHVGWIPLVRDWGGNNLAVDLAPGPSGRWGQVIVFGRDYDTKYVVARSWAAFLALVADDLNSGKWQIDDETGELRLQEFRKTRVEPPYFSILRWRMDQKHGRRAAKRASMAGPLAGTSPRPSRSASPYASPVDGTSAGLDSTRGRSMQRLSGSSPKESPMRPIYGKPPPLTRVAEERTIQEMAGAEIDASMLVEVESPRASQEGKNGLRIQNLAPLPQPKDVFKDKENEAPETKLNGKQRALVEESMKTIEI